MKAEADDMLQMKGIGLVSETGIEIVMAKGTGTVTGIAELTGMQTGELTIIEMEGIQEEIGTMKEMDA